MVTGWRQKTPPSGLTRFLPTKTRARGIELFKENCASCHGPTGRGDGPAGAALNPKPVDLAAMAGMHPDGDFAWKIAEGRGAMPAWKTVLSKDQIWDVVNYIKVSLPALKK